MFTFSSSVKKSGRYGMIPYLNRGKKARQMLIVNNFPRGIMDDFYFLSLSLSLFLVSVFCGEHVLCDKKEKVGIDKHIWSRVLRTQVPVAAPDSQDSVSLARLTPAGVSFTLVPPFQAVPSVPQSFLLFLPLFHFLSALSLPW